MSSRNYRETGVDLGKRRARVVVTATLLFFVRIAFMNRHSSTRRRKFPFLLLYCAGRPLLGFRG